MLFLQRSSHASRLLALSLLLLAARAAFAGEPHIIAYYTSWQWSHSHAWMTPDLIPYQNLTTINYAFFSPLPDGTIGGIDTVGDRMILRGGSGPGKEKSGPGLTRLAHAHGVKVLLSIGGWTDSGNFPAVAAHDSTRVRFAHSCLERVREFGFDGIDIDWEFPGYAEHNGTPGDRVNFTSMLRTLRDSLDLYGRATGKHPLLTAALPADPHRMTHDMQADSLVALLDYFNIMTYDFYGSWDSLSNHNSPLYPAEGCDSAKSVNGAFTFFHRTLGIPAGKLNLGVPFYGHTFTRCTALLSPHAGEDTLHFAGEGAFYAAILERLSHFTRTWDTHAHVPYLVSTEWNLFVSYDDEESIAQKGEYILDRGVNGVIIWEISGDRLPGERHPLLDALTSALHRPQAPQK